MTTKNLDQRLEGIGKISNINFNLDEGEVILTCKLDPKLLEELKRQAKTPIDITLLDYYSEDISELYYDVELSGKVLSLFESWWDKEGYPKTVEQLLERSREELGIPKYLAEYISDCIYATFEVEWKGGH